MFIRVIKILLGLLVVLGLGLCTLRYWIATHRDIVFGETAYQNSEEYHFSQNQITRWVTITKQGKKLYHFYFYPQTFAVWVHKTKPLVLLVTSDTGSVDGAHGLYLYDGKTAKKVYQARTTKFESGEKSPSKLYASYIISPYSMEDYKNKLTEKKESMQSVFSLSPDGQYLFGYESGYEGGAGFTIDLNKWESIPLGLEMSNDMVWNPEFTCAINPVYTYGDEQGIQLVYYDETGLKVRSFDNHFFASDIINIVWGNNCRGIITIDTGDYDKTGMSTGRHREYYRFSHDQKILTRVGELDSQYVSSIRAPAVLENIFFVIQSPKLPKK